MAKKKDSAYPVGYKKPPRQTQFKPGQSGNPNGRPKRGNDVPAVLAEELHASVEVTENSRPKKMSRQRAIVKRLVSLGMGGNLRAISMLLKAIQDWGDPNAIDPLDELLQQFREIHRRDSGEN